MVTIVSLYCCNKYSMFTLNMSNVKLIPRLEPSHHQASVVVSCCPIRDRDPWSRDTCWPISGGYPWSRQTNYQLSPVHHGIHLSVSLFSTQQQQPPSLASAVVSPCPSLWQPGPWHWSWCWCAQPRLGTLLQSQCSSWFADLLITELVCDTLWHVLRPCCISRFSDVYDEALICMYILYYLCM